MKEWWTKDSKDLTTLILTGAKSVGQIVAGDGNITGNSNDHLPSAGGDNSHGGNAGTDKRVKEEKRLLSAKKDLRACNGFNAGSCAGKCG